MVYGFDSTSALSIEYPTLGADLDGLPLLETHELEQCCNWLKSHRLWGQLSDLARQNLVRSLHLVTVKAATPIYQANQEAIGLYLLKSGEVEVYGLSDLGKSLIRHHSSGDLFGYVSLMTNLENGKHQTQAIALTESEIWFLSLTRFRQLIQQYPEIEHLLNAQLAEDLNLYIARIAQEQHRIQGLQSYIHAVPKEETILGNSKATHKLTEYIEQAAATLKPVIFQAQPGSGKTFLAGFIHAHSELADEPFAELDCAKLLRSDDGGLDTDLLFGRIDRQKGIIELLERGTLLLNNVQVLSNSDRDRLIDYLNSGLILPNHGIVRQSNLAMSPPQPVQAWVRLIFASPQKLDLPDTNAITIKLQTLPQRKADIPEFARYFLNQFCQNQNRPLLQLDQSDLQGERILCEQNLKEIVIVPTST